MSRGTPSDLKTPSGPVVCPEHRLQGILDDGGIAGVQVVAMKMRAFSLVELLVVMVIIALLAVLTLPVLSSISGGASLTRAGQLVSDQFAYARQEAVGKNREVQVRFVWRDGAQPGYAGVQLWAPAPNDVTSYRPISRIAWLPDGTVMASNARMSPLIASASIPETTGLFPDGA